MMFQNGITGTTSPAMWFPAGAFENENGVQAPVGFFDPLGLSKDGDVATFTRRRRHLLRGAKHMLRITSLPLICFQIPAPSLLSKGESLRSSTAVWPCWPLWATSCQSTTGSQASPSVVGVASYVCRGSSFSKGDNFKRNMLLRGAGDLTIKSPIHFADVPNGLKACSAVPASGWLQIILYVGLIEVYHGYDNYTRGHR